MNIIKELQTFAKDLSVLVVEDDKLLCQQIVDIVSLFFKEVHYAYNGSEGLESYKSTPTDLLITDITMPIMNGIVMSRLLKRINNDLPIMVISAHDSFDYMSDIIDLGIKQFVKKPFEEEDLLYRLLKICEEIVVINSQEEKIEQSEELLITKPQEFHININHIEQESLVVKTVKDEEKIEIKPNIHQNLNIVDYKDHYESITRDDIDEMTDLLLEMDSFVFLGMLQDTIESEYILEFSQCISKFGNTLTYYPVMAEVGGYMSTLGFKIKENVERLDERRDFLGLFFEAFIVDLHSLMEEAFLKKSGIPTFYNKSIIIGVETILSELSSAPEIDIVNEVEFF